MNKLATAFGPRLRFLLPGTTGSSRQSFKIREDQGRGVAQDYAQARQWYQKAAEAGNADAMVNLGFLYEKGWGVTQDYAQARWLLQQAAEAGIGDAMVNLGRLYETG